MRMIGIDVPGFGVPTHAEAKDVLAGCNAQLCARGSGGRARSPTPRHGPVQKTMPTVTLLGEMFPADPDWDRTHAGALGPRCRTESCRRVNGASSTRALDCAAVAAIHPFYTASVREFEAAGRPVVGSAPVGRDGTADWLAAIGEAVRRSGNDARWQAAQNAVASDRRRARRWCADQGPVTVSGYEGSELLVGPSPGGERRGRALCGHAPARATPLVRRRPGMAGGQGRGQSISVPRSRRRSLHLEEFKPDLAIGTTPVVQQAKESAAPRALLHEPDIGPAA